MKEMLMATNVALSTMDRKLRRTRISHILKGPTINLERFYTCSINPCLVDHHYFLLEAIRIKWGWGIRLDFRANLTLPVHSFFSTSLLSILPLLWLWREMCLVYQWFPFLVVLIMSFTPDVAFLSIKLIPSMIRFILRWATATVLAVVAISAHVSFP